MDLLSRLLALMPVAGSLDTRCHFGAPWRIDGAPAAEREIAWHVLVSGTAVLEDASGAPARMQAGDIVLFPSGSAHTLHDGSGRPPAAPTLERRGAGFAVARNDGNGDGADLLCGRFLLPPVPRRLLSEHLPARLLVRGLRGGAAQDADADPDAAFAGTRLARLIQLMREETAERRPGSASLVDHLSGALFALTLRFASEDGAAPRGLLALASQPRLQPALDAMFDEPGKPWTLPALAERCHLSRATFIRYFDDALGCSATDVLTDIRMTIAGRRLAQTALPVAQIGEDVGYQSDAAFQRAFKKYAGMTPAQWRAHARGTQAD